MYFLQVFEFDQRNAGTWNTYIVDTIVERLGQCTSSSLFHNFDVSQRQFKPDSLIISGQVNSSDIKTSTGRSYRSCGSMGLLKKGQGYFQAQLVTKAFQIRLLQYICLNSASTLTHESWLTPWKVCSRAFNSVTVPVHCTILRAGVHKIHCLFSQNPLIRPSLHPLTDSTNSQGLVEAMGGLVANQSDILVQVSKSYVFGHGL